MNNWQEAQEEARKSGTNIIFSQDCEGRDVALLGNATIGWLIIIAQGIINVATSQGVNKMLEELHLPLLDWH